MKQLYKIIDKWFNKGKINIPEIVKILQKGIKGNNKLIWASISSEEIAGVIIRQRENYYTLLIATKNSIVFEIYAFKDGNIIVNMVTNVAYE